jgi:hypothetical protein
MSSTPEESVVSDLADPADLADGEADVDEMPPPPDSIREAARSAPDHWFGMVDPTWTGEGAPPQWAMVGQWRSDLDGEIVEWQDNEEYRPSPSAMGWPDPTDPVDFAVQFAATGYGPGEEVPRALADAEVAVFVTPGGGPLSAVAPDGETPVVPVFTSPEYLHAAGRLSFKSLNIPELLDQLPEDHLIYLNPTGPVSMTLDIGVLREAIAAAGEEQDGDAEEGWLGALDDVLPASAPEGTGASTSSAPARSAASASAKASAASTSTSTVPTGDLL